jgi:hypothetical protein
MRSKTAPFSRHMPRSPILAPAQAQNLSPSRNVAWGVGLNVSRNFSPCVTRQHWLQSGVSPLYYGTNGVKREEP